MAAPEGYKALGKIGISYKGDYNPNTVYERLDAVYHNGSTYLAIKDAPDGAPRNDKINWIYLAKGYDGETVDVADSEIAFTDSETRENIVSGEKVSTVFGKIKKFFTDLTAPAFAQMITTKEDLLATKVTGYVPDAKAVADAYTELNGNLKNTSKLFVPFVNKKSVYFYYTDKAYGYGAFLAMDNYGVLDFYILRNVFDNVTSSGVQVLPSKSLGTNSSVAYIHYRNGKYDFQIVFTSEYSHGMVVVGGGSIMNYSEILQE